MTLLLITLMTAQADDKTTQYAPVTTIDFEDLDVAVETCKPQINFIRETKRPNFKPGDLINKFIIEPKLRPLTSIDPEEMPHFTDGE